MTAFRWGSSGGGGGFQDPLNSTVLPSSVRTFAAGYSLRQLSPSYEGAAIRVVRDVDDVESDIGFLANGHLDLLTLWTFIGAGTAWIKTWYDQSGNGHHATQATKAEMQKIVDSGVLVTRNGYPSAIGSAASGEYALTNALDLARAKSDLYFFCPCEVTSSAAAMTLFIAQVSTGTGLRFKAGVSSEDKLWVLSRKTDAAGAVVVTPAVADVGEFLIRSGVSRLNSTLLQSRKNGTVIAENTSAHSAGTTDDTASTGVFLFANFVSAVPEEPHIGYVSEFLFYNSPLTDSAVATVEDNEAAFFLT